MKKMTKVQTKKQVTKAQVTDIINKNDTTQNVAQKTGYSEKTVQKQVSKGKLNLSFTPDTGDVKPPPIDQTTTQVGAQQEIQIDYYATAKGFVQFVDMMLWFVAKISRFFCVVSGALRKSLALEF